MRLLAVFILLVSSISHADTTISNTDITVTSSTLFQGAISSVIYKGTELIDSVDRGRLLQSAVSFDNHGECYNPTEGGSANYWSAIPASAHKEDTSLLLSSAKFAGNLWTVSRLGFWLNPGEVAFSGCGYAVNTVYTSDYTLAKHVKLGFRGYPHVINHEIYFNVPRSHTTATFEALTGYFPYTLLPNAIFYDPATGTSTDAGNFTGEQQYPVIHTNPSGTLAVGVYSPSLPQNWNGALVGYGRFAFPFDGVNKFNCVFRVNGVIPKTYGFQCLTVVGTLAEVKSAIDALSRRAL